VIPTQFIMTRGRPECLRRFHVVIENVTGVVVLKNDPEPSKDPVLEEDLLQVVMVSLEKLQLQVIERKP
jgi:hypothetical protein